MGGSANTWTRVSNTGLVTLGPGCSDSQMSVRTAEEGS